MTDHDEMHEMLPPDPVAGGRVRAGAAHGVSGRTPADSLSKFPPDKLLTLEQLGKESGRPPNTFQKAISRGRLKSVNHNGSSIHLVRVDEARTYLLTLRRRRRGS